MSTETRFLPEAPPLLRQAVSLPPRVDILDRVMTEVTIVREICPVHARYGPQILDRLAILRTTAGETEVYADGRRLRHQAGSLVLLAAGIELLEEVSAATPWAVTYIMFAGAWATALQTYLQEAGQGAMVYYPAPHPWQQRFENCITGCFEQQSGWEWRFLSDCAALFGEITTASWMGEREPTLRRQVEQLIDARLDRAWSVDEVARELGLTSRQLQYRFRSATGMALAQWIRQRRITVARRLLQEGCSVTQAAERLGFANPYHFCRVFKATTGVPPSVFRRTIPRSSLHGD